MSLWYTVVASLQVKSNRGRVEQDHYFLWSELHNPVNTSQQKIYLQYITVVSDCWFMFPTGILKHPDLFHMYYC